MLDVVDPDGTLDDRAGSLAGTEAGDADFLGDLAVGAIVCFFDSLGVHVDFEQDLILFLLLQGDFHDCLLMFPPHDGISTVLIQEV
ncbi:hypothetical protein D3C87_1715470 [compost metagenome]